MVLLPCKARETFLKETQDADCGSRKLTILCMSELAQNTQQGTPWATEGWVLILKFCDSNKIDHFGCDAFPLVKISCSETWLMEQTVIICAVLTLNMTLTCVVLSYACIVKTILRFPSAQQRKKAFSTCSSHMIVVSITYGTCIFIYMNPTAKEEVAIKKVVSLLIFSVSPMLNPFIYTLWNQQVKQAFKDIMRMILSSKPLISWKFITETHNNFYQRNNK